MNKKSNLNAKKFNIVGGINDGNNCYFNAAIQILLNSTSFKNYLAQKPNIDNNIFNQLYNDVYKTIAYQCP